MSVLSLEDTISKLYNVDGLKFGEFTMRTGEVSPVYVDMRVIWSYPDIVVSVAELLWKEIKTRGYTFDHICGLPYQGIPIASYLSTKYNIPMLLKRQKPKTYGTCRYIEGRYGDGERVLLIDDVVMTGGTLVDDIPVFRTEGLEVVACVSFIDRDQGGADRIQAVHGTDSISVVTLPRAMDHLVKTSKLSAAQRDVTLEYLRTNRFDKTE